MNSFVGRLGTADTEFHVMYRYNFVYFAFRLILICESSTIIFLPEEQVIDFFGSKDCFGNTLSIYLYQIV